MTRRYPLAALVAATGLPEAALGREVGIDGTTLKRAREHGLVASAAERYATRAGFHPFNVWPEMMVDAIEDASVVCAAEGCDVRFIPGPRQRFCSHRCSARESARRRYHQDAELRERRKAAAAAWRAANTRTLAFHPSRQPEARRAQSATYYERHGDEVKARKRERYQTDLEHRLAKNTADRARYHARNDEENAA